MDSSMSVIILPRVVISYHVQRMKEGFSLSLPHSSPGKEEWHNLIGHSGRPQKGLRKAPLYSECLWQIGCYVELLDSPQRI